MQIKAYKNLAITTPECHPGAPIWCADFQLDRDVSPLFPYINAVVKGAVLHEKLNCIIFQLEKVKYSLYPEKASAAPFIDRAQAVKSIEHLIQFLNELDHQKATVTPNHKKFQPPVPILEIFKLLPRTNCKKCGVPTCMAFAAALSKREAELKQCRDFQDDNDENFLKLESLFPISHGTE